MFLEALQRDTLNLIWTCLLANVPARLDLSNDDLESASRAWVVNTLTLLAGLTAAAAFPIDFEQFAVDLFTASKVCFVLPYEDFISYYTLGMEAQNHVRMAFYVQLQAPAASLEFPRLMLHLWPFAELRTFTRTLKGLADEFAKLAAVSKSICQLCRPYVTFLSDQIYRDRMHMDEYIDFQPPPLSWRFASLLQLTQGVHELLTAHQHDILRVLTGSVMPEQIRHTSVGWRPWPTVLPVTWSQEEPFEGLYNEQSPVWCDVFDMEDDGLLDTLFEVCEQDPYGAPQLNPAVTTDRTTLLKWTGNNWDSFFS